MIERFDIVIVGAGMAGASLAAALGQMPGHAGRRVLLLEAEDRPGYHATGRSAAFWTESYGGPGVQPLTTASGPVLRDMGFLVPRGALTLARAGQEAEIEAFAARFAALGVRMDLLGRDAIAARVPGLRAGWTMGAFEPDCCDIDVAALHQHCLAAARHAGARLWCGARLVAAVEEPGGWRITLADGREVSTQTASWAQQWGSFAVLSLARMDGLWTTSALMPAPDLFDDPDPKGMPRRN